MEYALLIGFCTSFLVSFIALQFLIIFCHRFNLLDRADGAVKNHKKPTPHFGGLAIGLALGISFFVLSCIHFKLVSFNASCRSFFIFLLSSYACLLLGFFDDLFNATVLQKFFFQTIIASFYALFGFNALLQNESSSIAYFMLIFNIFFYVALINAFNLIDIFDGLAAIVSIVSFSFLALILTISGAPDLVVSFIILLLGAIAAFLFYNWPPATIYLGDTGALFIGSIAAFAGGTAHHFIFLNWHCKSIFGYMVTGFIAFMPFLVPLFELLGLILLRMYKNIPFYLPSKDHFIFYLKKKDWGHKKILFFAGCVTMLGGLTALVTWHLKSSFAFACCIFITYAFVWGYILIGRNVFSEMQQK